MYTVFSCNLYVGLRINICQNVLIIDMKWEIFECNLLCRNTPCYCRIFVMELSFMVINVYISNFL